MSDALQNILTIVLALMGASIVVAGIGLALLVRSIRRLNIPRDVDFFTTLRMVPLALVVLLDLLDFGLDIFSAPFIWLALDRMGLPNLRNRAVIEALIPITGPIPTFTICWIAARVLNLGAPEATLLERYRRNRLGSPVRGATIIDHDEVYER